MKNLLKKIISIALCAIFTLSLCSCTADKKDLDLKSVFTDTSKVSYTREYVTLKKNKKNIRQQTVQKKKKQKQISGKRK